MDWSLRRPWGFLDAVALSRGERYILANRGTRCIDPAMDSSVYLAHSFGGRYGFVQPETERDRSDVGIEIKAWNYRSVMLASAEKSIGAKSLTRNLG